MAKMLEVKDKFMGFFPELLDQLKQSPALQELPAMQEWIEKVFYVHIPSSIPFIHSRIFSLQVVEYNVVGGKMNRGIALVESYAIFQNTELPEEDLKIAIALGWAIELVLFYII